MKTVMKNILLGSVAGLAMVGTAAAADLPVKAKAAEYVKICSTYGAGFYYIPGTDTCLKVGGFVQADYYYQDYDYLNNADFQSSYFRTRGTIRLDARTQTEYGTLRSFIDLRATYGDGLGNVYGDGGDSTAITLDKGYIQFAGFTFGKVQSFFDYYADNNVWGFDSVALTADTNVTAAAYTADFGGGFTATISIEDDSSRSNGDSIGEIAQPDIPALIGNINYEGEWGGFQIAGAIRQLDDSYYDPFGISTNDSVGWAVLGGVKFNLPTLGEGDTLYIEGTYGSGAVGYTGINGGFSTVSGQLAQDLYYNPVNNTLESGDAWTIAAELTHFFTPQVFGVLYGNYGQNSVPDTAYTYLGYSDFSLWTLGGSLNWSPVKNLLFVAQYTYAQTSYDNPVYNDYGSLIDSSDNQQVILSVRRTF
ncbi:porin [Ancylobacter oerskovii]